MAGYTLVQATAMLEAWLAAELALATSQSYTITTDGNSRTLTRANLPDVAKRVEYWRNQISIIERRASGRGRSRYLVN